MLVFSGHCCSGTPGGECEDQSGLIPGAARESAMVLIKSRWESRILKSCGHVQQVQVVTAKGVSRWDL